MDDSKVFELERLKLAYKKQLLFMASIIIITIIGFVVYIFNIYSYNQALLIAAVVIVITGIIGIMTIDQKIKLISKRMKRL